MEKNYKELLNKITTFVFDVDGVLTDGTIQINSQGELFRTMHTKDGFALKTAMDCGYNICIISGGSNEGVRLRLEGLGIKDIHLGAHHKTEIVEKYLKQKNLTKEEVLYMGDDLPDFKVMQIVGFPCAPQDAVQEIKSLGKYVSHKNGGKGCVRDVIEQVLKVQGNWNFKVTSANYD